MRKSIKNWHCVKPFEVVLFQTSASVTRCIKGTENGVVVVKVVNYISRICVTSERVLRRAHVRREDQPVVAPLGAPYENSGAQCSNATQRDAMGGEVA